MSSFVQCKCGAEIEISPYLNGDLILIADDLAHKLELAEAKIEELQKFQTLFSTQGAETGRTKCT